MKKLEIPYGLECQGCPYYRVVEVQSLTKTTCKYKNDCSKDCKEERCENVIAKCEYKNIQGDYTSNYLLASGIKICGEHTKRKVGK